MANIPVMDLSSSHKQSLSTMHSPRVAPGARVTTVTASLTGPKALPMRHVLQRMPTLQEQASTQGQGTWHHALTHETLQTIREVICSMAVEWKAAHLDLTARFTRTKQPQPQRPPQHAPMRMDAHLQRPQQQPDPARRGSDGTTPHPSGPPPTAHESGDAPPGPQNPHQFHPPSGTGWVSDAWPGTQPAQGVVERADGAVPSALLPANGAPTAAGPPSAGAAMSSAAGGSATTGNQQPRRSRWRDCNDSNTTKPAGGGDPGAGGREGHPPTELPSNTPYVRATWPPMSEPPRQQQPYGPGASGAPSGQGIAEGMPPDHAAAGGPNEAPPWVAAQQYAQHQGYPVPDGQQAPPMQQQQPAAYQPADVHNNQHPHPHHYQLQHHQHDQRVLPGASLPGQRVMPPDHTPGRPGGAYGPGGPLPFEAATGAPVGAGGAAAGRGSGGGGGPEGQPVSGLYGQPSGRPMSPQRVGYPHQGDGSNGPVGHGAVPPGHAGLPYGSGPPGQPETSYGAGPHPGAPEGPYVQIPMQGPSGGSGLPHPHPQQGPQLEPRGYSQQGYPAPFQPHEQQQQQLPGAGNYARGDGYRQEGHLLQQQQHDQVAGLGPGPGPGPYHQQHVQQQQQQQRQQKRKSRWDNDRAGAGDDGAPMAGSYDNTPEGNGPFRGTRPDGPPPPQQEQELLPPGHPHAPEFVLQHPQHQHQQGRGQGNPELHPNGVYTPEQPLQQGHQQHQNQPLQLQRQEYPGAQSHHAHAYPGYPGPGYSHPQLLPPDQQHQYHQQQQQSQHHYQQQQQPEGPAGSAQQEERRLKRSRWDPDPPAATPATSFPLQGPHAPAAGGDVTHLASPLGPEHPAARVPGGGMTEPGRATQPHASQHPPYNGAQAQPPNPQYGGGAQYGAPDPAPFGQSGHPHQQSYGIPPPGVPSGTTGQQPRQTAAPGPDSDAGRRPPWERQLEGGPGAAGRVEAEAAGPHRPGLQGPPLHPYQQQPQQQGQPDGAQSGAAWGDRQQQQQPQQQQPPWARVPWHAGIAAPPKEVAWSPQLQQQQQQQQAGMLSGQPQLSPPHPGAMEQQQQQQQQQAQPQMQSRPQQQQQQPQPSYSPPYVQAGLADRSGGQEHQRPNPTQQQAHSPPYAISQQQQQQPSAQGWPAPLGQQPQQQQQQQAQHAQHQPAATGGAIAVASTLAGAGGGASSAAATSGNTPGAQPLLTLGTITLPPNVDPAKLTSRDLLALLMQQRGADGGQLGGVLEALGRNGQAADQGGGVGAARAAPAPPPAASTAAAGGGAAGAGARALAAADGGGGGGGGQVAAPAAAVISGIAAGGVGQAAAVGSVDPVADATAAAAAAAAGALGRGPPQSGDPRLRR
ncbi:hypothetical protein VOLCADRAFT_96055 [Volvox carteri f. nagariensis]|uniref:Uncharacterized protein n=1 Tax=Volvox carteri f. nagariensis TaxID=3068 RepID=D8U933_VOLCA|nr:uncharacterized protein VOLCADRAFT_96055 [Volvox carteri f. nagariensis]EFJ43741.1 hypothetical protein VOLCADRAFT_96055 [Volvox carteri f. nagariensis]|eukprot:XP_002955222.1 hypothetical protein VOLCADRAFT_96055 [Volvox carteri f. nagariensis]